MYADGYDCNSAGGGYMAIVKGHTKFSPAVIFFSSFIFTLLIGLCSIFQRSLLAVQPKEIKSIHLFIIKVNGSQSVSSNLCARVNWATSRWTKYRGGDTKGCYLQYFYFIDIIHRPIYFIQKCACRFP